MYLERLMNLQEDSCSPKKTINTLVDRSKVETSYNTTERFTKIREKTFLFRDQPRPASASLVHR